MNYSGLVNKSFNINSTLNSSSFCNFRIDNFFLNSLNSANRFGHFFNSYEEFNRNFFSFFFNRWRRSGNFVSYINFRILNFYIFKIIIRRSFNWNRRFWRRRRSCFLFCNINIFNFNQFLRCFNR